MRKIILSSISAGLLVLPLIAIAAVPATAPTLVIMTVLNNIVNWLFSILLIVAAIFIIVAAYFFVTAMGDTDKVATARMFVLYALIGVLVAFCARGLVALVELIAT